MNDDLIRRSDAINLCEKWRNRTNEHHDKNGWYIADTLLKATKELPSADRPQAEWRDADGNFVPLDEDGCTTASAWCSNCGEWLTGSDEHWTSGRFCPNCGYRMKGADDE